jgi:histidinol-phosphate aminotransferase
VEEVQRELGLERVVKLASNESPFGPFPSALDALARANRELNRYPDGGGWRLRSALADRHGVRFEEVALGSGSDGVVDTLSQVALTPGDEIVCAWPGFPSYGIYATKLGAVATRVPLTDDRHDLDALLDRLAKDGVRIDPKRQDESYGRFAWIYDPDGNKIELWQPLNPNK